MWKLASDKHPYIKEHGRDHTAFIRRYYTIANHKWPLLALSIHNGFGNDADTFRVSCDQKDHKSSWWEQRPIPVELAPNLIDLILEFQKHRDSTSRIDSSN